MTDDWQVPAWNAKAPLPCTKEMLCRWLSAHHEFDFTAAGLPRMETILRALEYRYGPGCPNTGGGDIPATWDMWNFTVTQEKRLRGGQRSLFG